jgi:uncharacterized DUF497 family protein
VEPARELQHAAETRVAGFQRLVLRVGLTRQQQHALVHDHLEDSGERLGMGGNSVLLLVSHTFQELSDQEARVRLISAREATAHERRSTKAAERRKAQP